MKIRKFSPAACALALSLASAATAQDDAAAVAAPEGACRAFAPRQVKAFAELPPMVQELVGGMADPDQDFNATDMADEDSGPTQRLVFGGPIGGDLYVVVYEQGGIARRLLLAVVETGLVDGDNKPAAELLMRLQGGSPDALCVSAKTLLDNDVLPDVL